MKNIIKYISFGVLCGLVTACTPNYEYINQNHAGVTEEQAEADGYNITTSLITLQNNVISTSTSRAQYVDLLLGGTWGRYAAESKANSWPNKFSTFDPPADWSGVEFNEVIPYIFPYVSSIERVTDDVVPQAIAHIIKVAAMYRVTDTYGPIPYTQVGVDGQVQTAYDSQEQVYKAMFVELNQAITELTDHQTESISQNADLIFKGDLLKWIRFANSLKLRLAIRTCYVPQFNVDGKTSQQLAEEAVNHSVGVMTSNDDVARLTTFSNVGNPLNEAIKFNEGDHRAIADMTIYMNAYNDPRRAAYFNESGYSSQTYCGLRTGLAPIGSSDFNKFSTIKIERETPLVWMYPSEVMFLCAEGALRGWNMGGGTAQSYYEQGIKLSFEYWGVSDDNYIHSTKAPDTYSDPSGKNSYSNKVSNITVQWNNGGVFEENLERIIVQKWLANFLLGLESWSDMRRTGYPKVLPVVQNNSNGLLNNDEIPRRCIYPTREGQSNAQNYQAALKLLGGPDNLATHLWWDCKE